MARTLPSCRDPVVIVSVWFEETDAQIRGSRSDRAMIVKLSCGCRLRQVGTMRPGLPPTFLPADGAMFLPSPREKKIIEAALTLKAPLAPSTLVYGSPPVLCHRASLDAIGENRGLPRSQEVRDPHVPRGTMPESDEAYFERLWAALCGPEAKAGPEAPKVEPETPEAPKEAEARPDTAFQRTIAALSFSGSPSLHIAAYPFVNGAPATLDVVLSCRDEFHIRGVLKSEHCGGRSGGIASIIKTMFVPDYGYDEQLADIIRAANLTGVGTAVQCPICASAGESLAAELKKEALSPEAKAALDAVIDGEDLFAIGERAETCKGDALDTSAVIVEACRLGFLHGYQAAWLRAKRDFWKRNHVSGREPAKIDWSNLDSEDES